MNNQQDKIKLRKKRNNNAFGIWKEKVKLLLLFLKMVFQIENAKLKDSLVREGEKVAFHFMHCLSLVVVVLGYYLLADITK
jgi:hypothetical protein